MRAYADTTKVTVEETILEIRKVVAKYGGAQFVFGVAETHILIGFTRDSRQVRVQSPQDVKDPQKSKARARSLYLVVKAKLEAVHSGISIFEDEFLAYIVLPDGKLVGSQTRLAIAAAYEGKPMPVLLPDYSGRAES